MSECKCCVCCKCGKPTPFEVALVKHTVVAAKALTCLLSLLANESVVFARLIEEHDKKS